MVTKRLLWYKNKLTGIFGGVKVREIDGYYVFVAVKKSMTYAKVENPSILKRGARARAAMGSGGSLPAHKPRRKGL
jgi:16S rRNA (guanine1207-N2)-methyltransferase